MLLIDQIILAKTNQDYNDFTGGNIQFSVSKYTKILSIKLVLYFGFNEKRNSIQELIEIQEKDISVLMEELLIKTKQFQETLMDANVLDLETFVNIRTKENDFVRMLPSGSDRVGKVGSVNVDKSTAPLRSAKNTSINDEYFNTMWEEYTLKFINHHAGRKDNNKAEARKQFNAIMKMNFNKVAKSDMYDFLQEYVESEMSKKDYTYCRSLKNLMQRDNIQNYLDQIQE